MLKEDYDLTREDIQLLSGRDALAAFFAKLGYDTNARLVQNAAAMSITSDSLKSSITHIERLASQDVRGLPVRKERLARTDVLIDAVVYRLYGLTEEEIKIVEGKA
jgi:hypothetical protein